LTRRLAKRSVPGALRFGGVREYGKEKRRWIWKEMGILSRKRRTTIQRGHRGVGTFDEKGGAKLSNIGNQLFKSNVSFTT